MIDQKWELMHGNLINTKTIKWNSIANKSDGLHTFTTKEYNIPKNWKELTKVATSIEFDLKNGNEKYSVSFVWDIENERYKYRSCYTIKNSSYIITQKS